MPPYLTTTDPELASSECLWINSCGQVVGKQEAGQKRCANKAQGQLSTLKYGGESGIRLPPFLATYGES
jgi:hypothetical protein